MASFFTLTLDTTAPAGVTVKINADAQYTTTTAVELTLTCTDADLTGYQMKIYGDVDGATTADDASWQAYAATKSITLTTGDGRKTVNVIVRDDVGNESTLATDTIMLNTVVPVVTITGPDKAKISKVNTFDTSVFTFVADVDFIEYKVGVVSATASLEDVCAVIPTTGGSENTSGSVDDEADAYKADTPITVKIKGVDLESASSGDGAKIIKAFVKNVAGTWSMA